MSKSQITWIDREALTALARQAGLAKPPKNAPLRRVGIGLLRSSPPSKGEGLGLLAGTLPVHRTEDREALPFPEFTPPDLPLKGRINALMDWLARCAGASRAFLADGDGLPLAQRSAGVELIGIAAVFADAAHQLARTLKAEAVGAVHVDLDAGNVFHLIGLEHDDHRLALGFVTRRQIDASALSQIADSVIATMAEKPGDKTSSYY